MNLQQYRYVQTIAKVGSFSQAAKELFVTQPSLSSSIKELESELDVQLFHRSKSGTCLTEAGSDFLIYAKRILAQVEEMEQHFLLGTKKSFTVSSQHYDFLYEPFLKVTEKFQSVCQNFYLNETTTKRILESIRDFESELGIIYLNPQSKRMLERYFSQESLNFEVLGNFSTHIYLGAHHPLAAKRMITKAELSAYPQVRFIQEDHGSAHLNEDPIGVSKERANYYTNDRGTLMKLLAASDAYASGLGIIRGLTKDQIVLRPLQDADVHSLVVITNRMRKQTEMGKFFLQELKKTLQEEQE
ncbi:LysR family transcriptional regulator [Enterococcus hulanensis]|uniref:LysR family transcriptional regulator n=1 Tax=Enterococcus hulanensis TaxID=2559929 RepID=UPI002890C003|nr:LysR family transcriptional regulator [Enterococcus hulanensis]MDT2660336.1 LysR family transcriptional regulator [Enterococcus hulanensis]